MLILNAMVLNLQQNINIFYCSIIFPPLPQLYITQSRYSSAISTPLEPSFFQ
jgi:hypothetical protein